VLQGGSTNRDHRDYVHNVGPEFRYPACDFYHVSLIYAGDGDSIHLYPYLFSLERCYGVLLSPNKDSRSLRTAKHLRTASDIRVDQRTCLRGRRIHGNRNVSNT
jgi:hypothetical protein